MEPATVREVSGPPARPDWSELLKGERLIDLAFAPGGKRLRLVQCGDDFAILLDDNELMSTDLCASEQILARIACAELAGRSEVKMLIGGYGMGYTLRAALDGLDADAELTVAEIVPKIVEWARGPMHHITAGCLSDPRVQLVQQDVALLIDSASGAYDCILLDVDNGPEGLTCRTNDWLYSSDGLAAARKALTATGVLAIWSAFRDDLFVGMLARSGFTVNVVTIEPGGVPPSGSDGNHVIIVAHKTPAYSLVA